MTYSTDDNMKNDCWLRRKKITDG